MKKILINLIIIIIAISVVITIPNKSFADVVNPEDIAQPLPGKTPSKKGSEVLKKSVEQSKQGSSSGTSISGIPDAGEFDPRNEETEDDDELLEMTNKIIGWVELAGVIVSVLVMCILGVKYMVGSVEEKAEYKKSMQPYFIGCLLTFGTVTILKVISVALDAMSQTVK